MPGETATSSPKAKSITRRSSIRQSLNLASVSKAFAEVINKDKDNKDTNKHARKTKESRRLSAVNPITSATPRTSMGDTRSPSQATVRTLTPESRTSGRRRLSERVSPTEQPGKCDSASNTLTTTTGVTTRAATLRARNMNTTASSLPIYRPKSIIAEPPKQPPSPSVIRVGTRRRLSTSDDEKEEKAKVADPPVVSEVEKGARPISPLPQRAALRSLNTPSPTPTPTPPVGAKVPPIRGSPIRPSKTVKTTTTAPRPPPSSSSNCITPSTPKTPKSNIRFPRQDKNKQRPTPDSITSSSQPSDSPSPPSRHARFMQKASPVMGNMSHISEGSSEDDEDEEAVEMLLAPVADMTAPTPAMPRIQKTRPRRSGMPKTPTRAVNQLPARANMSYLSPMPPGDNSSSLRPPQPCQKSLSARNAGRGSILSWEQLASEASKTLGEDELEKMLADIPAPFQSGLASPALSANLEIPASPCLSMLDSPGGYGSISQVLLPDVTPSPAMHASQRFSLLSSEDNTFDSPTVTLLRLQLAQAENIAKQRLMQMQAMEQEIYSLQDAHARQMQETTRQIEYLEAKERKGEESMNYLSFLEDQLRQMESRQREAIELATKQYEERTRRSFENEKRKERLVIEARATAYVAKSEWLSAKELSEVELDLVQGDRAVLAVLLTELDHLAQTLVI